MPHPPSDNSHETRLRNLAGIAIGAGMLALPVAMNEDTWVLAPSLGLSNYVGIVVGSILLISFFVYTAYFHQRFRKHWLLFLLRVSVIYGLTLVVSSVALIAVNQANWLTEPALAAQQTVLVALPASFAATVVDNVT